MAENLAFDAGEDCWAYDNDESNVATYGRLYTWEAAKSACPLVDGWHLPTDREWQQLEMATGLRQNETDSKGWLGTNIGTKLKATNGWNNSGNGTDDYGFSGLPGGYRALNGPDIYFRDIGNNGSWWSATSFNSIDSYQAWYRCLHRSETRFYRDYDGKKDGNSIRCVRDFY